MVLFVVVANFCGIGTPTISVSRYLWVSLKAELEIGAKTLAPRSSMDGLSHTSNNWWERYPMAQIYENIHQIWNSLTEMSIPLYQSCKWETCYFSSFTSETIFFFRHILVIPVFCSSFKLFSGKFPEIAKNLPLSIISTLKERKRLGWRPWGTEVLRAADGHAGE